MGVKFQYSPLPPVVKIGESEINGHGILAADYIPANTMIGITHIDVSSLRLVTSPAKLEDFVLEPTHIQVVLRGVFHNELIRTPLGGYLNHSPNPNCILIPDKVLWYLWTTEDIPIDDELCVNYELYRCGYKVNDE